MREFIPPKDLGAKIIVRIDKEKRRNAISRFLYTGTIMFASLLSIIPSMIYLGKSLQISGFAQYFSLFFSDLSQVALYWKEFSFSLAESLPFISLALFLALLGTFIWSFSITARNAKLVFNSK